MASVFLSYDRDDADKVRAFVRALEEAGHSVWWDLHVRGGAQFGKVIEEALKAADAVVVLWSRNSIESAWVKDEAAVGRDTGRLIPVTIDGTEPPLGFRQFQTIDLSRWTGRRKPTELNALLAAVQTLEPGQSDRSPIPPPQVVPRPAAPRRSWFVIAAGLAVAAAIAGAALLVLFPSWGGKKIATVAVRSVDSNPASDALSRDLLVQLGELRPAMAGSMRLVNSSVNASDRPDFVFQTAALADNGGASLLLADAGDEVLWSKQFDDPKTSAADRRQQIAYTAARVLRCALQESSGEYGRLQSDTRQVFLDACAASAEIGWDTRLLVAPLRKVTQAAPKFRPAWALLLIADSNAVSFAGTNGSGISLSEAARQDSARARSLFPKMAEASIVDLYTMANPSLTQAANLVERAKLQDPDNPAILNEHAIMMMSVGRLSDAIEDAQRAANLDPLSPTLRTALIRTLAYAGQIDPAREELDRAKRLWPGTETVRQAEFSIEFRYGDFQRAVREVGETQGPGYDLYAAARLRPNDTNVARLIDFASKHRDSDHLSWIIQALGEMNRVDRLYDVLQSWPLERDLKQGSYVFFRPWLAKARRDPRFMIVAKRVGLVDYWQQSGKWPDFCGDSQLPYDCKKEAAKLSA
jgi:tetratricopeptide (TPR) repeat protein